MQTDDYRVEVRRHDRVHNPDDAAQATKLLRSVLGLCSEAGEVAQLTMRAISGGYTVDTLSALDELGDALFNIVRGLDAMGLTIEDAMVANIAKLNHRVAFGKDKPAERLLLEDVMNNRYPERFEAP